MYSAPSFLSAAAANNVPASGQSKKKKKKKKQTPKCANTEVMGSASLTGLTDNRAGRDG